MLIKDQLEIANIFNEYFSSIGEAINGKHKSMHYSFKGNTCDHSIYLVPTNCAEIMGIISSLKPSISAGHDGLNTNVLKACSQNVSVHLSAAVNNIIESVEKVIYNRIINFLNKHNLMFENLNGFLKGKSTSTAAAQLIEEVIGGIESKEHVAGVYLDLEKAFDCVNVDILLDKLWKMGIRGAAYDLIKRVPYLYEEQQMLCEIM
ncbi:uncharacterized protein LOC126282447 [Schistocerca gregaria]|uniref:uncharacterized protein LOC126282447 n=1 Tax=Schistocerca gregaria TaxID=7010 RepID=UPI00211EE71F|nr:uncharacterized protein LOC126282447 [Schistocerca gregaria]